MISKRQLLKTIGAIPFFSAMSSLAVSAQDQKSSSKSQKPSIAYVYVTRTGNTESIGLALKALCNADLYRVETVVPYPKEYKPTTEVVKEELAKGIIREIKPVDIDLSKYDVIVLGTPTWWHHVAVPLQTWIKSVDLTGKHVLTCNSHGGGGVMHTREDFENLLKGKNLKLGSHLTVGGSVTTHSAQVIQWLQNNNIAVAK